jgi:hypothetical protein
LSQESIFKSKSKIELLRAPAKSVILPPLPHPGRSLERINKRLNMANNTPPNGPAKTGNKSGGGRGNNPPKGK